jgi:hypothetical protein
MCLLKLESVLYNWTSAPNLHSYLILKSESPILVTTNLFAIFLLFVAPRRLIKNWLFLNISFVLFEYFVVDFTKKELKPHTHTHTHTQIHSLTHAFT